MLKSPEFYTSYDYCYQIKRYAKKSRIWRNIWPCSYQIQRYVKSPEFDAKYDPVVTESKGMLKNPEFDENQSCLIVHVVNFTFVGKLFRFAPLFNDCILAHIWISLGAIFILRKTVSGWVVEKMAIFPYFMQWKCPYVAQWVRRVQKRNLLSWISPDFIVLVNYLGFE